MLIEEPLWTSAELHTACGFEAGAPWYADGLQVDSREIMPGDLFVALPGSAALNGHDFVADAFSRGAVAALVSQEPKGVAQDDARLVYVKDTTQALQEMAVYARDRAPVKTIAVTGSAGKTSVVHALRKALGSSLLTHSSVRSFNNSVGIPVSLARMPRESRYGVFEVGMNQPGEIARGGALVRPDIALITTIGLAHAGSFESFKAIADEKISLVDTLSSGGIAVLGMDHEYSEYIHSYALAKGVKVITVSVTGNADVRPLRMTEKSSCTCMTADIAGTTLTYKVGQPGREWALNSLLVLAAVHAAGGDIGQAALALASLEVETGRGQAHTVPRGDGYVTLLDDSYNANPLSVCAALRRLSLVPVSEYGHRIAVLADIEELGEKARDIHLSMAKELRQFQINKVIALGENMAALAEEAGVEVERYDLTSFTGHKLFSSMKEGDALMVKGANKAGLGKLVKEFLSLGQQGQAAGPRSPATATGW